MGNLVNGLAIFKIRLRQELTEVGQELSACIDMGANYCFTRPGILTPLGFKPHGSWNPPLCDATYPSFDVEIAVSKADEELKWLPVKLMEDPRFPFDRFGCELAVGQDFLKNCRFEYNGREQTFNIDW